MFATITSLLYLTDDDFLSTSSGNRTSLPHWAIYGCSGIEGERISLCQTLSLADGCCTHSCIYHRCSRYINLSFVTDNAACEELCSRFASAYFLRFRRSVKDNNIGITYSSISPSTFYIWNKAFINNVLSLSSRSSGLAAVEEVWSVFLCQFCLTNTWKRIIIKFPML